MLSATDAPRHPFQDDHRAVQEFGDRRAVAKSMGYELIWLAGEYAICRLPPDAAVPAWATAVGSFVSITRTTDELSVICDAAHVPAETKCTRGWRLGWLAGVFAHDMAGVLASVTTPLAAAGVGVFVCATFDTDYLLVRTPQIAGATRALISAGHMVRDA
jgi:hypothetical protein